MSEGNASSKGLTAVEKAAVLEELIKEGVVTAEEVERRIGSLRSEMAKRTQEVLLPGYTKIVLNPDLMERWIIAHNSGYKKGQGGSARYYARGEIKVDGDTTAVAQVMIREDGAFLRLYCDKDTEIVDGGGCAFEKDDKGTWMCRLKFDTSKIRIKIKGEEHDIVLDYKWPSENEREVYREKYTS